MSGGNGLCGPRPRGIGDIVTSFVSYPQGGDGWI
jgi:hypothetical protein